MGVGTNLLASITGNPVQGVITIVDKRPFTDPNIAAGTTIKSKAPVGASVGGMKKVPGLKAVPFDPTQGLTGFNPISDDAVKKRIFVQFNPSTITIQAQGGGAAQLTNFGGKTKNGDVGSSIKYTTLEPRITVTIPLVFDKENNCDAFLQDKLIISPTSTIKNVATGIGKLAGYEYTVQPQVEGLVAALRNEYTREIMFSWSEMSFHGVLNGINSQYTMFSSAGMPIRAMVNLTILCTDTDAAQGFMGQWQERYMKAFVDQGNVIKNSTAGQAASSLLNLG